MGLLIFNYKISKQRMSSFAPAIAAKLSIRVSQVETVLQLFAEAATIPFIARYRKDRTGALDEVQIQVDGIVFPRSRFKRIIDSEGKCVGFMRVGNVTSPGR